MIGLGTIVNTLAIIAGGILGIILKSGISEKLQSMLTKAVGVAVIFVGISGTLEYMLVLENGRLATNGTMLLIISLILGGLAGEIIDIEKRLEGIGEWIKARFKRENDSGFVEGFVASSVIICVGAMAIVGSVQDGLMGDSSVLFAKSALDFVILIVNGAVFGVGAIFSAVPLFLYQGAITLCAYLGSAMISDALMANLSMVGSAIIFCIGVNQVFGKKINVGNMLPALLVPVIYSIIF